MTTMMIFTGVVILMTIMMVIVLIVMITRMVVKVPIVVLMVVMVLIVVILMMMTTCLSSPRLCWVRKEGTGNNLKSFRNVEIGNIARIVKIIRSLTIVKIKNQEYESIKLSRPSILVPNIKYQKVPNIKYQKVPNTK